jgi:ABC-type multidrug transport system permease subunit
VTTTTEVRHPIVELSLARFREWVREPEAIFWAFIFPIVMSVALAVAFPGQGSRPVIVGMAHAPETENSEAALQLRTALEDVEGVVLRDVSGGDVLRVIRDGDVHVIVIPGDPPTYRFDPERAEARVARLVVDDALKRAAGRTDPWAAREEPIVVAGSRYIDWLIPGLLGMNIMSTGMWGIGFSIVQARLRKLLKRLAASPMRRSDYLLAQMIARLAFLAPEVAVPLGFGALVLGMPVRGSFASIAAVSVLGAFTFTGIGLLAASRPRTLEAISGVLNLTMVPMWVLSGVFFSSSNFPSAFQPFIQALPLTALNDALRAVILEGATLAQIGSELVRLAVWAIVTFVVALKLFRWR